jgi:hypothetical protein
MTSWSQGQPGAPSSNLRRVRGSVRSHWVLCTQSFPAFLQETVSKKKVIVCAYSKKGKGFRFHNTCCFNHLEVMCC